jgi:hypothetical protein
MGEKANEQKKVAIVLKNYTLTSIVECIALSLHPIAV